MSSVDITVWKPVPIDGYSDYYLVSNDGRVKSLDREQVRFGNTKCKIRGETLSPLKNPETGYLTVRLQKNGKSTPRYVHRLVLKAFVGPPSSSKHVSDHIDRNKENNNVENLRWITNSENVSEGSEYSDEFVAQIKWCHKNLEVKLRDISKAFNVTEETISGWSSGKYRSYIGTRKASKDIIWQIAKASVQNSEKYDKVLSKTDVCHLIWLRKRVQDFDFFTLDDLGEYYGLDEYYKYPARNITDKYPSFEGSEPPKHVLDEFRDEDNDQKDEEDGIEKVREMLDQGFSPWFIELHTSCTIFEIYKEKNVCNQ